MSSVFISYAHEDKEFARRLASDLSAQGVAPWIDEMEIKVGDSLLERLQDALRRTDFMIALLSERSVTSAWVQKELKTAFGREIETGRTFILPVVIGDVKLPSFLLGRRYVDLSNPKTYRQCLDELVSTIRGKGEVERPRLSELINATAFAKEVAKEVAQVLRINAQGIREPLESQKDADTSLVFVIIAFSPDMEPIYEGIKAAGEYHGLRVERVKDVKGDYRITTKTIEMIGRARLVVADLTHERPNCYFELGYARGLSKIVITTARDGTQVHFDVRDWTCTYYNDSRVLERHLRERFAFELGKTESHKGHRWLWCQP
jgi:hypothetical protein